MPLVSARPPTHPYGYDAVTSPFSSSRASGSLHPPPTSVPLRRTAGAAADAAAPLLLPCLVSCIYEGGMAETEGTRARELWPE